MTEQPNIILILTDHFRPDAVGTSTPNLLSLAERGVRFANAYCASPLCQPARASIITGKLPSQHGICGNQADPIHPDLQATTFMRYLQEAGYHRALIGKHHYLDRFGVGMDVTDDDEQIKLYGFDSVLQVVDDENLHNDDAYTRHLRQKGFLERFRDVFDELAWECKPHPFEEEDTPDGFIGRRGVEFIEGQMVNTLWGVIIPFSISNFGIFLMRQYCLGVPQDLISAARIDGASEFAILIRIIFPVVATGCTALGILKFLLTWNDLFWPLIMLTEEANKTLTVMLATYIDFERFVDYGLLMAMTTLVVLPVILLFVVFQRRIIEGVALTGMKG